MPQWRWACALGFVLVAIGPLFAQSAAPAEKTDEPRSLTGTWVMLLEGHQVGLEGQRVPVDGQLKDNAFTLTSDAQVGDAQSHGATVKMKISGQHKPDDTLEGEIDLPRGPMKWTAERLKKP